MKIRFGLIYLAFLLIGILYEAYIHHFSAIAWVNYVLTGFLYSSLFYIGFYIIVRLTLFVLGRIRHSEQVQTAK